VSFNREADGVPASSAKRGMMTYLIGESICSQITQRKLESPVITVDIDFDSDESVWVGC
jgi:hypothetical protein